MTSVVDIFGGKPFTPSKPVEPDPPHLQLADAMRAAGINPPAQIHLDGQLHRFQSGTKGKPGHDKPGWYCAFSDGIPAGRFGCWRAGIEVAWRADIGRSLTPVEEMAHAKRMAEAIRARDEALRKQREVAADTVEHIWVHGAPASPDHPYLARKGIQHNNARVTGDGRLIVPLYTPEGKLASLQYIEADGTKRYHQGGQTSGCFWMIGVADDPGPIYIAEGFATAATIHEVTNRPCIVAYSAHNLVPVTGTIRERYGAAQELVIVADNDASGVGRNYADQASAKHGARVVMPPEAGDANDYAQGGKDLKALLSPEAGGGDAIKKLKVVFGDELPAEYDPPNELIENLMTIGSTTVVYGDSNSGKTFWALSVAAAIANGALCYGRKTDPGLVIYLACEAPGSIKARLQAIKRYYGCKLENIAIVPVPLNFYNGDADAVDVIEAIREIERVKGQPARLIIGDTLARMSAGANENSGEDMGPVMARFEQVCIATGAAMMIIHHNGKDAARGARGWSGIRAHIDTEIEVTEKDGARSAQVTKQRELPGKGDAIYFKLEVVEMGIGKFGGPASTCVAVPDDSGGSNRPKASPNQEQMKIMERAWSYAGQERRDFDDTLRQIPYISTSALREFLRANLNYSTRKIENAVNTMAPNGLLARLLNAEQIAPYEHGYVVTDTQNGNAWL
jgi:putative DNA primase/helicase